MSNKVEKFFNNNLTPRLKDLLIIRGDDGSYHLFGKYKITRDSSGYYNVENIKKYGDQVRLSSLKNAVTYCVFEKNNKKEYNKRLIELDDYISSLDAAITIHKKILLGKKPIEDKLIILTKLEEEKRKKRRFNEEISTYIETSKRWQEKLYQDNTPR